ncbi:nucleotidyl transferase AbiEii/AbiGii toxin family protein [Streptomyces sp. NPDC051561]|uniref:nucleotidyl transferase AbiEii/AbiGii toxin family protein n=1 Tax=Streptomyces sp. NPDC051561 TaxID=3365658 RepID=UPI003787AAF7
MTKENGIPDGGAPATGTPATGTPATHPPQDRVLPDLPRWSRYESASPRTLLRVMSAEAVQKAVFDPALKQYANAYRASDPVFPTPEATRTWQNARSQALTMVMNGVAASPWARSLVLRGSMLMALWFGEAAREPGDLDFVVVPSSWDMPEPRTASLLSGVAEAAEQCAANRPDGLRINAGGTVYEDIWTYERVPGRRMMLPWSAPGTPGGWLQLDFVFGESLPEPPQPITLPTRDVLLTASPALSLAWKVMWLVVDGYSQGKDLYDAALLAERHPLPNALLQDVFRLGGEWPDPSHEQVLGTHLNEALQYVEWNHFADEYPQFAALEGEFTHRLRNALAPTFTDDPR